MAEKCDGGIWDDRLRQLLEDSGCLFFALDHAKPRTILALSGGVTQITGYEPNELIGKPVQDFLHTEDWVNNMIQHPGGALTGDVRAIRIDGSEVWIRVNGRVVETEMGSQMVGLGLVIDSLKRRESVLRKRIESDSLTGLMSREAFLDRLIRELDAHDHTFDPDHVEDDQHVAIGIVDLDSFRQINETLGHPVGDEVLRLVGQRLASMDDERVVISRLGGDEFGVLILDVDDERELGRIANGLLEVIGAPTTLAGVELQSRASIGVSLADEGATSVEMLRQADIAMYQAKSTRNGIAFYSETTETMTTEQLTSAARLRRSMEDELVMWFQPIVDLWTGETVGVEGLARWDHPDRGILGPADFMAAIELGGLAERLDLWALESIAEMHGLVTRAGEPLQLSLNMTADGLRSARLVPRLRRLSETGGFDLRNLKIEVSERDVQEEILTLQPVLQQLRDLGVGISLDDFGTGFSSLTRLRELPFTEVKMDRTFVSRVTEDPANEAIVRSTVELSRALGLQVVAEGVEEEATSRAVAAMGCTMAQGYYFGRPMSVTDLVTARMILPAGAVV